MKGLQSTATIVATLIGCTLFMTGIQQMEEKPSTNISKTSFSGLEQGAPTLVIPAVTEPSLTPSLSLPATDEPLDPALVSTPCPHCKATGKLTDGKRTIDCPVCSGDGHIDPDPRDPEVQDLKRKATKTSQATPITSAEMTQLAAASGPVRAKFVSAVEPMLTQPPAATLPADKAICPQCNGTGVCSVPLAAAGGHYELRCNGNTCSYAWVPDPTGDTNVSYSSGGRNYGVFGLRKRPGPFGRIRARRGGGGRGLLGFRGGCAGC